MPTLFRWLAHFVACAVRAFFTPYGIGVTVGIALIAGGTGHPWIGLTTAFLALGAIGYFHSAPAKPSGAVRSLNREGPHGGWITMLAGSSHENPDGTNRQILLRACQEGEELVLVREPNNPFDRHAIKVLRKNGTQLGYIRAEVAQPPSGGGLATHMDEGAKPRCWLVKFAGGTDSKPTLSAALEVLENP